MKWIIPLRDIWCDINTQMGKIKLYHKTSKALERIIYLYSNEMIMFDIFAGSGTLGRSCINKNRNYILFDINAVVKSTINQPKYYLNFIILYIFKEYIFHIIESK